MDGVLLSLDYRDWLDGARAENRSSKAFVRSKEGRGLEPAPSDSQATAKE
jgi:hypothetical protein